MLLGAREKIHAYIQTRVSDFKAIFLSRAKEPFAELGGLMDDAFDTAGAGNADDSYISVQNATLWLTYTSLVSALDRLASPLSDVLQNFVSDLPLTNHFILDSSIFEPILPNVGTSCSWCYQTGSRSLLSYLRNAVYNKVKTSYLQIRLTRTKSRLENMYEPFLMNLYVSNHTGEVTDAELEQYQWDFSNASNYMAQVESGIQLGLNYAEEALELVDSLLEYAWGYKCQTELPKLINEYDGNHDVSMILVGEVYRYIVAQDEEIIDLWDRYVIENQTLEDVGSSISYDDITRVVSAKKLRLDSVLNDRILLVKNLERQINQIYYVIMSLVDTDDSAWNSAYWDEFGITNPVINTPTSVNIRGVDVPLPDFGMEPNGNADEHWSRLSNVLTFIRTSMESQVDDLATAVSTAKAYAVAYIDGNRINEDFYR